jgi:hypothetical protein
MTPDFLISADGVRLTERLQNYCTEITVIDEAGTESDHITLTLTDSQGQLPLPRQGAELTIALGYQETGLMPMGIYAVDGITLESPPRTITVTAHAANLNTAFKSQKTRSWEAQPLEKVITTIANENGYHAKIATQLKSIDLPHLDQTAESDLHFLTRLASQYGAIAKPSNGYLIFALKSTAQSISGLNLPTVLIKPEDTQNWRLTLTQRDAQGSITAGYHDIEHGQWIESQAGNDTPNHDLRQTFADANTAHHVAQSVLKNRTQSTATLNLTLIGNEKLRAETPIELKGFLLPPNLPTRWVASRVEHRLSPSEGFITRLTAQANSVNHQQRNNRMTP